MLSSLLLKILKTLRLSAEDKKVKIAIRELSSLSDRELDDLGIARCDIKHLVRFGRQY